MNPPTKKKKYVEHQRQYRKRKKAAVDRMDDVRACNWERCYEKIARLKATEEYEAFKKHKASEGKWYYHNMPTEREEVIRKNLILQKAWKERVILEGTYQEYRARLNARRQEQLADKKRIMGAEGWKEVQRVKYVYCVESEKRRRWNWLEEQLARPFPLQWLPLEWTEHEEKEEDTVQTIRANALESMNQFL